MSRLVAPTSWCSAANRQCFGCTLDLFGYLEEKRIGFACHVGIQSSHSSPILLSLRTTMRGLFHLHFPRWKTSFIYPVTEVRDSRFCIQIRTIHSSYQDFLSSLFSGCGEPGGCRVGRAWGCSLAYHYAFLLRPILVIRVDN